ncbi:MAG: hypothetical protein HZB86_07230 [Deltaproteobacteria bacterium]|nr:hypothetical protein [Deltaproteobacteria bacterium]
MCKTEGGGRTPPAGSASGRNDPQRPSGGGAFPGAACSGPAIGEYIDRIAGEMHERVEHQRLVLKRVVGDMDAANRVVGCPLIDCPRLARLTTAVRETIDVLEETRSAFKSKRLEATRRRLIEILAGR